MKNKNKMLLVILGVLLVMVVGVSFAYFLVNTRIFGDGASASLGTSNGIKVQYDAGSGKLEASSFYPKDIISKEFKVIVTPTNNKDAEEVIYRLKDSEGNVVTSGDGTQNNPYVVQ